MNKFAAIFIICMSLASGSAYALSITDGVMEQHNQSTDLINQGVAGNDAATNLTTGPTTSPTGGGGGGGGIGTSSSAVQALSKTCQVDVVNKAGQLQVFSVGVKCFENIVNGLAESTIVNFSGYLQNIVYTMLILYLILYGTRVSLGMHVGDQAKKEFIIHALKVAFVAWLIFSFGLLDIYNLVLSSYYSLITIVMDGANLGSCSGASAFSTGGTEAIWATMDCMLTKFVGWEATNGYGTQYKNVPLFLGIIFSKFLPANGFVIGGILFSALWALVSGFFRLAFIYILSIIALILLFSIAPMIIPMMLFKKTYTYFDGWVKLVVSMVLQPVILFAFFAFIASLMSTTIENMQKLFEKMKMSFQTSSVSVTGDNAAKNLDADVLLNGVVTFVIAYLLISFINYVSAMALELAGYGTAPNLGGMSSEIFGGPK